MQVRRLRLVKPDDFGGARLRPPFGLNQLGDLGGQLRPQHPPLGVGEDVPAASLNLLDFGPSRSLST